MVDWGYAMRAIALDKQTLTAEEIDGRILAHDVEVDGRTLLRKGHLLSAPDLVALRKSDTDRIHALALEPGDLPEVDGARRLAAAVAGPGVIVNGPVEGRFNIVAATRGVTRINIQLLNALNELDDVSIFTIFDGQVVRPGDVLAGVKVTPLISTEAAVRAAEALAAGAGHVVDVAPFRPLPVGVVIREALGSRERHRVVERLREKIAWFGSELIEVAQVADDPARVAAACRGQLAAGVRLLLATGGSALDPLDTMLLALNLLGARMEKFGAPAHPGSLFWLAYAGEPEVPVFGVASCGMFSKATAVDLLLPRVFAGERLDRRFIATLGQGGLLNKQVAFKFPAYDEAP